MNNILTLYNTLSRTKEEFKPLNENYVGMYVCGPTVYGHSHLGHSRPAITFDILYRLLKHVGYKVRYVRNITDVGHLAADADSGEDKIAKRAKIEQLEPMEVVQQYTNSYRKNMRALNVEDPTIEPSASGHIIEQIAAVETIIESGFGYESSGSVYFDVEKYSAQHHYGKLSGRKIEDLLANTRALDGQEEKRNPFDFALWKRASPEHIMRWPSPWSDGFPGWHMECTAMGAKYLGDRFDIHGGGMDLMFPHHEAEIAQGVACYGHEMVNYWMHNNMVTINGQKMGKSLGNFILLDEIFTGEHDLLEKAYSPMTIRFFILQAHYRSPLDFSNEALQAAEKGYDRLMRAMDTISKLPVSSSSSIDVSDLEERCNRAIMDDLNSPILIANLFDGVKIINSIKDGSETISKEDLDRLINLYNTFVVEILGLEVGSDASNSGEELISGAVDLLLELRQDAKSSKDWGMSDKIRDELTKLGVEIKDTKGGCEWRLRDI